MFACTLFLVTSQPTDFQFKLSIVIPTFDRGGRLQSCLSALSEGFPNDAEVIVVSDGGNLAIFPDLSRFKKSLNLRVVHIPHGGPASARNHGLELASAPIIAFIDDDCLPQPGWVEHVQAKVCNNPPTAAGGKTINGLPGNICAVASQLVLDIVEQYQLQNNATAHFYPSNNLAFPTGALREIGGFNVAFRTSEDRELCRRWLQSGFLLKKSTNAVLAHAPSLNLISYFRQYVSYGQGAERFHATSENAWCRQNLMFHIQVPALALAVMSEQKLKRRVSLCALLLVWECANLAGYLKQKYQRISLRWVKQASPGVN